LINGLLAGTSATLNILVLLLSTSLAARHVLTHLFALRVRVTSVSHSCSTTTVRTRSTIASLVEICIALLVLNLPGIILRRHVLLLLKGRQETALALCNSNIRFFLIAIICPSNCLFSVIPLHSHGASRSLLDPSLLEIGRLLRLAIGHMMHRRHLAKIVY